MLQKFELAKTNDILFFGEVWKDYNGTGLYAINGDPASLAVYYPLLDLNRISYNSDFIKIETTPFGDMPVFQKDFGFGFQMTQINSASVSVSSIALGLRYVRDLSRNYFVPVHLLENTLGTSYTLKFYNSNNYYLRAEKGTALCITTCGSVSANLRPVISSGTIRAQFNFSIFKL